MKKTIQALTALVLLAGAVSCTSRDWDEHYSSHMGQILDMSLMDALRGHSSEVGLFIDMLERTGYDTILATSQSYTVWAPSDAYLSGIDLDDEVEVEQVVKNHISRFAYPTARVAVTEASVKMLDSKRILFAAGDNGYRFGSQPLQEQDIAVNNGILHILDGYEPYVRNLFEYMKYDRRFQNFYDFIMTYDYNEFLPDRSTVIGVVDGQTVYDSVFYHSNLVFSTIGHIDSEEQTYTMIIPDNEAWTTMYDSISSYFFVSPHTHGMTQEICDSMQNASTNTYLIYDLVFKGEVTPDSLDKADMLMTTTGNVINDPQAFFAEEGSATGYMSDTVLSNGIAYRASKLNLSREQWCPTRIVEAEYGFNVVADLNESNTRNIFRRDARGTLYADSISEQKYLEVNAKNLFSTPYVTFSLRDLRSTSYNVYVVFVPQTVEYEAGDSIPELLPTKVWFELTYIGTSGEFQSEFFYNFEPVEVDPYRMDTVQVTFDDWLMEDWPVTFPYCDAEDDEGYGTRLRVYNGVQNSELDRYTRKMLIDCIIVEPVD